MKFKKTVSVLATAALLFSNVTRASAADFNEVGQEPVIAQQDAGEVDNAELDAKLYIYGWNDSGVGFFEADIHGWNDTDTTSPLTDASGKSMYHTDDNFGSDAYLVFDFEEVKEIKTIQMFTPNENILADSWAVYAGSQRDNAESSWDVLEVSSEMQLWMALSKYLSIGHISMS